MGDDVLQIKVQGLDKLAAGMSKFPTVIPIYVRSGGVEGLTWIIDKVQGLRDYPPAGPGSRPPTPYYQRGYGMMYKKGPGPKTSKNLGKQWVVRGIAGTMDVEVGNSAPYAVYVHGRIDTSPGQARAMQNIGWKSLYESVKIRLPILTKTYQAWINKCIKDLGL